MKFEMPVTIREGQLVDIDFSSGMPVVKILMGRTMEYDGCGDVYTVEKFKALCDSGALMNYDGFGNAAIEIDGKIHVQMMPEIYPSYPECIPVDATHIVWYNR